MSRVDSELGNQQFSYVAAFRYYGPLLVAELQSISRRQTFLCLSSPCPAAQQSSAEPPGGAGRGGGKARAKQAAQRTELSRLGLGGWGAQGDPGDPQMAGAGAARPGSSPRGYAAGRTTTCSTLLCSASTRPAINEHYFKFLACRLITLSVRSPVAALQRMRSERRRLPPPRVVSEQTLFLGAAAAAALALALAAAVPADRRAQHCGEKLLTAAPPPPPPPPRLPPPTLAGVHRLPGRDSAAYPGRAWAWGGPGRSRGHLMVRLRRRAARREARQQ